MLLKLCKRSKLRSFSIISAWKQSKGDYTNRPFPCECLSFPLSLCDQLSAADCVGLRSVCPTWRTLVPKRSCHHYFMLIGPIPREAEAEQRQTTGERERVGPLRSTPSICRGAPRILYRTLVTDFWGFGFSGMPKVDPLFGTWCWEIWYGKTVTVLCVIPISLCFSSHVHVRRFSSSPHPYKTLQNRDSSVGELTYRPACSLLPHIKQKHFLALLQQKGQIT